MFEISNAENYSESWASESDHLEANGIYQKLANITPLGNVLEFGCGVGNGTLHLAKDRNVLSFDNNKLLIDQALIRLRDRHVHARFHECDFFNLDEEEWGLINELNPKVIVGWFVGSHGEDIFQHTVEEPDPLEKGKLYREKIEDVIVSPRVCVDSVEYIHLALRAEVVAGFSDAEVFESYKEDYDEYVFNKIGFEVVEVNTFAWAREGSDFLYGQANNPLLAKGRRIPIVTSIIARRTHQAS